MTSYYTYLLLGPQVYSKHYTSPPEPPRDQELLPIKIELFSLKKSNSTKRISAMFGFSEDLSSFFKSFDSDREKEILDYMSRIPINPMSRQGLINLLNSDKSIEEILPQIPVGLLISTLEKYTKNSLVRSALGVTAESICNLLIGYKIYTISHYIGLKFSVINFKLGVSDARGNTIKKDYFSMAYFLAQMIINQ